MPTVRQFCTILLEALMSAHACRLPSYIFRGVNVRTCLSFASYKMSSLLTFEHMGR